MRALIGFMAGVLGVIIGAMCLVAWVDPMQLFRADPSLALSPRQRYQLAGLIRHQPYDAIWVGTSLSENTTPSLMRETLGWEGLQIVFSGSTLHEQAQAARLALTHHPSLKHVVWEMNIFSFLGAPDEVREGGFPSYLYDENRLNDLRYLLQGEMAWEALMQLAGKLGCMPRKKHVLETLHRWDHLYEFGEPSLKRHYCQPERFFTQHPYPWEISSLLASFEANMLPLLEAHPEQEVFLYFPPYSLALYHRMPELVPLLSLWKQEIAARVAKLPQVKLVDFQATPGMVDAPAHYMDGLHYDAAISRRIVQALPVMAHEVVTKEKMEAALARWPFMPPECP